MAPVKNVGRLRGTIIGSLQAGLLSFVVRAVPLPESITTFLLANSSTLKKLHRLGAAKSTAEGEDELDDVTASIENGSGSRIEIEKAMVKPEEFWNRLGEICAKEGKEWKSVADEVWAFGPKRIGANLLIDKTGSRS